MSATMTLKHKVARRSASAINLIQHSLLILGLAFALGLINLIPGGAQPIDLFKAALPELLSDAEADDGIVANATPTPANASTRPVSSLSPHMLGALDYVTRRYRVSPEAVVPLFEVAQLIGKERSIDPLLIVAVIGIESSFNPFAESTMGAQGLMQVIPRFHQDKVPDGAGDKALLDPVINIKVGTHVLEEAIRRRGGLIPGLQHYAGSSDPTGAYANKVLAEKHRLEQAARRASAAATRAAANSAPATPQA